MYDIRLSKEADRALRRMPRSTAAKIIEKIKVVSADPYAPNNNVKALIGRMGYRLRVGDWRVIYDLNDELTILAVERIAARGEVYNA
jgi:mRNA interferase RelE/StbE